MAINRVCISGNLTRPPELRQTAGGSQVLGFGVAVNDRRKNQQTGQWEDVPNFVDVTVFGKRAEPLSRYLHKGDKVAVEGRLRYSSWEGKDGSKRSKLEVVADEVDLMQRRQASEEPYQPVAQPVAQPAYQAPAQPTWAPGVRDVPQAPAPQVQANPAAQPSLYDADIPF